MIKDNSRYGINMADSIFNILQCTNNNCRFRFPTETEQSGNMNCPRCGSVADIVVKDFSNQKIIHDNSLEQQPELVVLLDNIRSVYNVGSMMRTGDGAGIKHFYLCGITATLENSKLKKTGLGAEAKINWSYHPNGLDLAIKLKDQGYNLWSLEGSLTSSSLFNQSEMDIKPKRIALVIGNEISGIDPDILEISDRLVSIPMQGYKDSLNVAIAFGIAAYAIRYSACNQ